MKKINSRIGFNLLFIGILLVLLGSSYAFFSYTAFSNDLVYNTGQVFLKMNRSNTNIILQNAFPEKYEEAILKNDNYIDFSVVGKNNYNKSVYYEIDLEYGDDVQNKERIDDKYLRFELEDLDNNEKIFSNVYFDSIDHLKLHVDTINTIDEQVTRNYRLRMWLDEHILISDSNPDADFKASNNDIDLQNQDLPLYTDQYASVKVKVYGDFIEKEGVEINLPLYDRIASKALPDDESSEFVTSSINYSVFDPTTNGKGIYRFRESANDRYPVYFYRATSNENNVVFANRCWKIVRTTSTGGVKLIYNGKENYHMENYEKINYSDYNITENPDNLFSYDSINNEYTTGAVLRSNQTASITTKIINPGVYSITYSYPSLDFTEFNVMVNGTSVYSTYDYSASRTTEIGYLDTNDIVKIYIRYYTYLSTDYYSPIGGLTFNLNIGVDDEASFTCVATNTTNSIDTLSPYDGSTVRPEGVETLNNYNTINYTYYNYLVGTDYVYQNGKYSLINPIDPKNLTDLKIDDNTYYSYLIKSNVNSSNDIYLITSYDKASHRHNSSSSQVTDYYFKMYGLLLQNGEKEEDVLKNIINDTPLDNQLDVLSTFYESLNIDDSKVENETFCNDRGLTVEKTFKPYSGGGFSSFKSKIFFNSYLRTHSGNITLKCPKEYSYSVSTTNGNGLLRHPIGFLSIDEYYLTGGSVNTSNADYTMSYVYFNHSNSYSYGIYRFYNGGSYDDYEGAAVSGSYYTYIRPSISLRKGIKTIKGDGSSLNPYVIE